MTPAEKPSIARRTLFVVPFPVRKTIAAPRTVPINGRLIPRITFFKIISPPLKYSVNHDMQQI